MSTKINGIKISDVSSIAKVLAFADDVRAIIRDEIHAHRAQEIKMMACVIYDMYHSAGHDMINPVEDDTRIPLLIAMDRIVRNNRLDQSKEEYTLSFSTYKGSTYAISCFFHQPILETLLAHPQVKDYSYWNNTDKPEDVTELQWHKRRDAWDSMLTASGIPAESMLTIRLMDSAYLIPDDKFMHDLPTPTQREEQMARIVAFQRAESELTEENVDFAGGRVSLLVKRVGQIFPEVAETIRGTLKPITMDDLGVDIPKQEEGDTNGKEEISETSSTD